ncbi:hypothetical protein TNCV_3580801 [Trichonephila clavipes]|nr:hypothetical protein TNCV_3580801 [Trichonephila clavipes]
MWTNGQVTWMTPELAASSPNYHTNGRKFRLSTDLACIAALNGESLVVQGSNSGQSQPRSDTYTTRLPRLQHEMHRGKDSHLVPNRFSLPNPWL